MGKPVRRQQLSPFEMEREYKVFDATAADIQDVMNAAAKEGYQFKTTLNNGKQVLMEKSLPKGMSHLGTAVQREAADLAAERGRLGGAVDAKAVEAAFDRASKAAGITRDINSK